jgi:hypothetical protein
MKFVFFLGVNSKSKLTISWVTNFVIKNSEKTTILFQVHVPTTDKFVCTKCEQKLFHSTYL